MEYFERLTVREISYRIGLCYSSLRVHIDRTEFNKFVAYNDKKIANICINMEFLNTLLNFYKKLKREEQVKRIEKWIKAVKYKKEMEIANAK